MNPPALDRQTVLSDLSSFRKELAEYCPNFDSAHRRKSWRPMFDTVCDWSLIVYAIYMGCQWGGFAYPLMVFIVANRQRALGNLLHESAHQNLYRSKLLNDLHAVLLLGPAVMTDLGVYRDLHFKHHSKLGKINEDPDYIVASSHGEMSWYITFLRELFSLKIWMTSIFGHAIKKEIDWRRRAYLVLWWVALFGVLAGCFSISFALQFMIVWFISKATVFHVMTICREMCDHFGLELGGIYLSTRDIVATRVFCWVIHPRNNAYHLTHHLMPSIPYYHLRAAQKIFRKLPSYVQRGIECKSYLFGRTAVVRYRIKT